MIFANKTRTYKEASMVSTQRSERKRLTLSIKCYRPLVPSNGFPNSQREGSLLEVGLSSDSSKMGIGTLPSTRPALLQEASHKSLVKISSALFRLLQNSQFYELYYSLLPSRDESSISRCHSSLPLRRLG